MKQSGEYDWGVAHLPDTSLPPWLQQINWKKQTHLLRTKRFSTLYIYNIYKNEHEKVLKVLFNYSKSSSSFLFFPSSECSSAGPPGWTDHLQEASWSWWPPGAKPRLLLLSRGQSRWGVGVSREEAIKMDGNGYRGLRREGWEIDGRSDEV